MARATRLSSRVDFLVFLGCILGSLVALVLPVQMREPLAESLRRTIVAPLVGLQSNAERWSSALQSNEERTARLDSAIARGHDVVALRTENDELRKLLGLGARLQTGFVPAEAVHNAVREDVVTTLTLTAGSRAGIHVYSPVVSDEGVVGVVQTVDPTISIAILFSHPDFRASAMSGDGTAFGIVYPHLQQGLGSASGAGYLLELRGVPFRNVLPPGTMIYTSGLGGTFPRGIPLGSVLRELKTAEGWTRTYLVQPSVNPAKVTSVMVLTPTSVTAHRATPRYESVWQRVARVDSATRGVVNAGDSLARKAAADSARRAAAATASATPARPAAPDSAATHNDSAARDSARQVKRAAPPPLSDSARAARAARRDSARRDSLRRDSTRRDSTRRDTTRRDTTVRRDTTGRESPMVRP